MAKTPLKAAIGKVIVKYEKPKETFGESKIIKADITKKAEEKAAEHGVVKLVGDDIEDIKPGYELWFEKHSGTFLKIDEEDLLVINYSDCLCYKGE